MIDPHPLLNYQNYYGYRIVERPFPGAATIFSWDYGRQPFAKTTRVCTKEHDCKICGRTIHARTDQMYRPIGNPMNRHHRICVSCVERVNPEAPEDAPPQGGDAVPFDDPMTDEEFVRYEEAANSTDARW